MVEVSLGLMSLPASWEEAKRHADLAQNGGFDSLWTGDHLRHPRDPEQAFLDGWTLLPAWAAITSEVRIGMLVSNLIYRHPALLARQAAAADEISEGRLVLGVGAGVYETDHRMAGVPLWRPGERVERLEEFLDVLDALLRGQLVNRSGAHYPVADAIVRPSPVQTPRPPIVVGALGPRTIDLAVRFADTWNTWAGFHAERSEAAEAVRRQSAIVDEACERHDRDPASLRRSICLYPPFDPWAGEGALQELISLFLPLGLTEYIVYPPPPAKESLLP